MSQKEKLIKRFSSLPKDFTYDELRSMLGYFGYEEDTTPSGSRIRYYNIKTKDIITLHKPHPGNIMKMYKLKEIKEKLEGQELI